MKATNHQLERYYDDYHNQDPYHFYSRLFQDRVNTIYQERRSWQDTQFKTANDALYELLAQIYALYDDSKGATAADEAKREWLLQQCAKRNLPLNKNPSFIQLLVKLVFCDTDTDSRRISSYARVLTAAAQSSEVTVAADVPVFIRKYGGVEEIRASLAKGTKTPKQRADAGRSLVLNSKSLAEVTVDSTKHSAATLKGSIVLLVGVVTAKGSVEVRNVCFELSPSDSVFTAKTAVSAALSNVYTNHSRQTKAASKQQTAEQVIADKNARALSVPTTAGLKAAA